MCVSNRRPNHLADDGQFHLVTRAVLPVRVVVAELLLEERVAGHGLVREQSLCLADDAGDFELNLVGGDASEDVSHRVRAGLANLGAVELGDSPEFIAGEGVEEQAGEVNLIFRILVGVHILIFVFDCFS